MLNPYERTKERMKERREYQKQRTIVTVGDIVGSSLGLLEGDNEIVGNVEGFEVGNLEGADDVVGVVDGFDVGGSEGDDEGLSSFRTQ